VGARGAKPVRRLASQFDPELVALFVDQLRREPVIGARLVAFRAERGGSTRVPRSAAGKTGHRGAAPATHRGDRITATFARANRPGDAVRHDHQIVVAKPAWSQKVGAVNLTLGTGGCARIIEGAEGVLRGYLEDEGRRYLAYRPTSRPDAIVPEGLAVTLLVNSCAGYRAFKSIQDRAADIDLSAVPDRPLESTDPSERAAVVALVAEVAGWPGFGASLATKVLHKKRPALVPVLDNQAIFGAYLNPGWPAQRSRGDSVWSARTIADAIEAIRFDLTPDENRDVWPELARIEPERTLVELLDMVWWVHFRNTEPVRPVLPPAATRSALLWMRLGSSSPTRMVNGPPSASAVGQ